MLHEIGPHKLYNEFRKQAPKPNDFLVVYVGDKSLLKKNGESYEIPRVADFNRESIPCHYLFSIDDASYFLAESYVSKTLADAMLASRISWTAASRRSTSASTSPVRNTALTEATTASSQSR